jgi:hypothetical protein
MSITTRKFNLTTKFSANMFSSLFRKKETKKKTRQYKYNSFIPYHSSFIDDKTYPNLLPRSPATHWGSKPEKFLKGQFRGNNNFWWFFSVQFLNNNTQKEFLNFIIRHYKRLIKKFFARTRNLTGGSLMSVFSNKRGISCGHFHSVIIP